MAFIEKAGKGWCVKQGNTGKVIRCFTGKDAKGRAEADVKALHKKHQPKASSRGKRAMKANDRRQKKK